MRIVVASDLHANLAALDALPNDYDQLWVLGDLVNYGPSPCEVLEFVRRHATLVVRGNHDHALGFAADPQCSAPFRAWAAEMAAITSGLLSGEQKAYLRSLPLHVRQRCDGRDFLLCHAAPSDPLFRYCPPDSPDWPGEAERAAADFLLVGHTHLPFIGRFGGGQVVNPGSLGQPKTGRPDACFAIWDGNSVALHERAYDVGDTVERLRRLSLTPQTFAGLESVLTARQ
jgi:protein phosphatase